MTSLFQDAIIKAAQELAGQIKELPFEEQVETLNRVRRILHQVSPFAHEPIDLVEWVPVDTVHGNDYNPNHVAPPEMKLLKLSIEEDGYTQPIVGMHEENRVQVVDGFHRSLIGRDKKIRSRLRGYVPVTFIKPEQETLSARMASTIRHNRARGVHGVDPMADIVASLIKQGLGDTEIAKELGMDADEILRFRQKKPLPELFRGRDYSKAWE